MTSSDEKLLFPGCTIGNRLPYLEATARKVFNKLDIKTDDAPFACCPDPVGAQTTDVESWLALGARNLALAEEKGKDIVSLCNGCTQTLHMVNHELKHDPRKKGKINKILGSVGKQFNGTINVHHFVKVLRDEVGVDKIKSALTKPLSGLKVACHTGCHYSRPSEVMQYDDPMKPLGLRELVAATGATVVDYTEEILCCGSGATNTDPDIGLAILKKKFDSLAKSGADCVAVICPACYMQLDTQQKNLEKKYEKEYGIPILYLTELMALAMGYTYDDLSLKLHRVRPKALAEKL